MINISYRNHILLFLVFFMVFFLVFPGLLIAEDDQVQVSNNIITLETQEQVITGQTITLVAEVRDNEYNEPVAGGSVAFFVKTSFFINDLVEIGKAVTGNNGIAELDYEPNQPGEIQIVASYTEGSGFKPVIASSTVIVSGETQSFYQTNIGIGFPNSFIVWMVIIIATICGVWGTFLYVIYNVIIVHISRRGTGAKAAPIILMIVVSILLIIILLILGTPEPQYNFGLPPS